MAGLGFPPVAHIKSAPAPIPRLPKYASRPTDAAWLVNPARLSNVPVFVPSQLTYDELGRTGAQGYEVDVAGLEARLAQEGQGERADGVEVSEWYTTLASRTHTPLLTPGPSSIAGPSRPSSSEVIDLSLDSDGDDDPLSRPGPSLRPPPQPIPKRLQVPKSEWFIRRALSSRSDTSSFSAKHAPAKPLPISNLLNLTPLHLQPQPARPAQYVLGPENKGYALLRDRLGWEGGGLGRPDGWVEQDTNERRGRGIEDANERRRKGKVAELESGVIEVDDEGNQLSPKDQDRDEDEEGDEPPPHPGGPGRTAPIATVLKIDRLGLGHGRARRNEKKVTHTIEEIQRAQRQQRGVKAGPAGELGKKAKVKWKVKERRERDERKSIMRALND
ncbi:hypothetical protein P7C73_g4201, partial [Tremellales sp. Uapishka_1]